MKNTLTDLNDHMVGLLEAVTDPDITGEKLEETVKRAKAGCQIGAVIVNTGRLALEAEKFKVEHGVEFIERAAPMLTAPARTRPAKLRSIPND